MPSAGRVDTGDTAPDNNDYVIEEKTAMPLTHNVLVDQLLIPALFVFFLIAAFVIIHRCRTQDAELTLMVVLCCSTFVAFFQFLSAG